MSSDIPRDAKGRYAGANQSASEADQRNQTPSTVLRAVDEEEEERPVRVPSSIPRTEPRGPEQWKQQVQATPATVGSRAADPGTAAEDDQERFEESLVVNRNLLEQLAQAKLESEGLHGSPFHPSSDSESEEDEELLKALASAEKKREMRTLRRKALKEHEERESQARQRSEEDSSMESSDTDSDSASGVEDGKQAAAELRRKERALRRKEHLELKNAEEEEAEPVLSALEKATSDSEDSPEVKGSKNRLESKLLARLKSGGGETTLEVDEEPLEVLWTFLDVKDINANLVKEDKNFSRTVDAVLAWKRKSLEKQFSEFEREVKKGGRGLRKKTTDLVVRLLRADKLGTVLSSAVVLRLMTQVGGEQAQIVFDVAQGMCRLDPEDFNDFEEECKKGYVDEELLDDTAVYECEGFKALMPTSKNRLAEGSWSTLLLAVTNALCHEPVESLDEATARDHWQVAHDGRIKAGHHLIMKKGERFSLFLAKHRKAWKELRQRFRTLDLEEEMPTPRDRIQNLMVAMEPTLRKAVETKLRDKGVGKDEVTWEALVRRAAREELRMAAPM